MCVCVLPVGRSILIVFFSWFSFHIATSCLSWFCPLIPFWVSKETSFYSFFLQSKARADGRDTMLQVLYLLLVVDIIDFSSSTRRNILSLPTLSDQTMLMIFLQSHISQLSNLCMPTFLNVNDSAPYSSVLQMAILIIPSLRLKLENFVKSFCVFENAFFAWDILDLSFLRGLSCVIGLPR